MELTLTLVLIAATLLLGVLSPLAFAVVLLVRRSEDGDDRAATDD